MNTEHPLRQAKIRLFQEIGVSDSWRTVIGQDGDYPVYFTGASEAEAVNKASSWRDEQLAKHEADFQRRQESAVRARKRAKSKEAEK